MEIIVMATSQTQASNFEFKATADFNGDGKPDIFCRDQATGQNEVWFTMTSLNSGSGWQAVSSSKFKK
jgi:hypothetical protein